MTMIYTHVLGKGAMGVKSPLDQVGGGAPPHFSGMGAAFGVLLFRDSFAAAIL